MKKTFAYLTSLLLCAGLCLSVMASESVPAPNHQPQLSAYYSPRIVDVGQSSTLFWNARNVVGCTDEAGNSLSERGFVANLLEPTTLTTIISCQTSTGSITKSATLTVIGDPEPPVIDHFYADNTAMFAGDSSTLHWKVSGATQVSITPQVTVASHESTFTVSPESTTTYELIAEGQWGTVTQTVTVNIVIPDNDNDGLPNYWELQFGLNPDEYDAGIDSDNDGLSNAEEFLWELNPISDDTDADGIADQYELLSGLKPNDSTDALLDLDGDGASNLYEYLSGTDAADSADTPPIQTIEHFTSTANVCESNSCTATLSWSINNYVSACLFSGSGNVVACAPSGSIKVNANRNGKTYHLRNINSSNSVSLASVLAKSSATGWARMQPSPYGACSPFNGSSPCSKTINMSYSPAPHDDATLWRYMGGQWRDWFGVNSYNTPQDYVFAEDSYAGHIYELRDGSSRSGALLDTYVTWVKNPSNPSVSLSAAPEVCNIPAGATDCETQVHWNGSGSNYCLFNGFERLGCSAASQLTIKVGERPLHLQLRKGTSINHDVLADVKVQGQLTPQVSLSSSACIANDAVDLTCETSINWLANNHPDTCLFKEQELLVCASAGELSGLLVGSEPELLTLRTDSNANSQLLQQITLQAKPYALKTTSSTCSIEYPNESCEVSIEWASSDSVDVCLYRNEDLVSCNGSGVRSQSILEGTTEFTLQDTANNTLESLNVTATPQPWGHLFISDDPNGPNTGSDTCLITPPATVCQIRIDSIFQNVGDYDYPSLWRKINGEWVHYYAAEIQHGIFGDVPNVTEEPAELRLTWQPDNSQPPSPDDVLLDTLIIKGTLFEPAATVSPSRRSCYLNSDTSSCPITVNWQFNTSSNYTLCLQQVDVSGSSPQLLSSECAYDAFASSYQSQSVIDVPKGGVRVQLQTPNGSIDSPLASVDLFALQALSYQVERVSLPTVVRPNNAEVVSLQPTFTFTNSDPDVDYRVVVSKQPRGGSNDQFQEFYFNSVIGNSTSWSGSWVHKKRYNGHDSVAQLIGSSEPSLLPGRLYYWHTVAIKDGIVHKSPQYTFTTASLPTPSLSGVDIDNDCFYSVSLGASSTIPANHVYELYERPDSMANWPVQPVASRSLAYGNTPPFYKRYTAKANGTYHYRARVCDAAECGDFSPIYTVPVSCDSQSTPNIQLTPVSGATLFLNEATTLSAVITNTTSVDRVEFIIHNDTNVSETLTVTEVPFDLEWTPTVLGRHNISAVIHTTEGITAASDYHSVDVKQFTSSPDSAQNGDIEIPDSVAVEPLVPVDSLQKHEQVGSTAGQFRVDESGAATYSIPIMAAPGTAGVTPQLALNYSSQSGRGIAGQGWSLSGLSSISRCRQTLGQDGLSLPITFTDSDRLCLDGQRLVAVSGAYGASGTIYETEIDSFAQVHAVGNMNMSGSYFEVHRKDGSVSTYGNGFNSALGSANQTQIWALSTFEDSVAAQGGSIHNTINYHYANDAFGHRLTTISYSNGNGVIDFEYDTTRPIRESYSNGALFKSGSRLMGIDSTFNGQSLRYYNLSYEENTPLADAGIDRLVKFTECTDTSMYRCLQPTQFTWSGAPAGFAYSRTKEVVLDPVIDDTYVMSYKPADVNGDGMLDLVWLELRAEAFDKSVQYQHYVHVVYSEPDGQGGYQLSTSHNVWESNITKNKSNDRRIEMIDYNNDGRQDLLIGTKKDSNNNDGFWQVHLSQPDENGKWRLQSYATTLPHFDHLDLLFMDMNSDGLIDAVDTRGVPDIYYLQESTTTSHSSLPYTYSPPIELSVDPATYSRAPDDYTHPTFDIIWKHKVDYIEGGDFNNDGRVDIIKVNTQLAIADVPGVAGPSALSVDGFRQVYIMATTDQLDANGAVIGQALSVYAELEFPDKDAFNNASAFYRRDFTYLRPLDVNGDGLSDIVVDSGGYHYLLNKGDGTFAAAVKFPTFDKTATAIDYDHNGLTDFVWFDLEAKAIKRLEWTGTEIVERDNLPVDTRTVSTYTQYCDGYTGAGAYHGHPCDNSSTYKTIANTTKDDSYIFADMNGDGIADKVRVRPNSDNTKLTISVFDAKRPADTANGQPPINSITSISNGMGNVTDVHYGTLNQSGHYSRLDLPFDQTTVTETNCLELPRLFGLPECLKVSETHIIADSEDFYDALHGDWMGIPQDGTNPIHTLGKYRPTMELNGPMYVVTQVASSAPASNDASAQSSISYYYGQGKLQASGRGFLGFQNVTSVDDQTGVYTTTQYRQDFPFVGHPVKTDVYKPRMDGSGERDILSQSINYWALKQWDSIRPQLTGNTLDTQGTTALVQGGFQPYIAKSVERTYAYNSDGVTNPSGSFTHNSTLTGVGNPLQTVVTENDYDGYGNVLDITVTTTGTDPVDQTTDTFIKQTTNTYGSSEYSQRLGRLDHTTVTSTAHGQTHTRESSFTYYPSGHKKGLLQSETIEPNRPAYAVTTTYEYDNYGNRLKATQSAAAMATGTERSAKTEYDNLGRFANKSIDALDNITSSVLERDHYGNPVRVADINGVETITRYDAFGRKVQTYQQTGGWTRTLLGFAANDPHCGSVNTAHTVATTQSAGGGQSVECFDVLGRSVRKGKQLLQGGWSYSDTCYDNLGRVTQQSLPHAGTPSQWTTMSYDLLGRPVSITVPDENGNASSHTGYNGFTTRTTNSRGQTKVEYKNALGQLVNVTDNEGGVADQTHSIQYHYDAQGNLEEVTQNSSQTVSSAGDLTTQVFYDHVGRKTHMKDPDKGEWHYHYNPFGELVLQTDGKYQATVMTYDILGRMTQREDYKGFSSRPTGVAAARNGIKEGHSQWTYGNAKFRDDNGVLTGEEVKNVLLTVKDTVSGYQQEILYDTFGRATAQETQLGTDEPIYTTHTSFDQYGRVFQQFDAAGNNGTVGDHSFTSHATQNEYNAFGYLNKVIDAEHINGETARTYQHITGMDVRGNITAYKLGSGLSVQQTYHPLSGRLHILSATDSMGNTVQDLEYQWDAVGNLSSRVDHHQHLNESFDYDGLNRLTDYGFTGDRQEVKYDGLGNITFKTGVGDYSYGKQCAAGQKAGPHAVCATSDGVIYSYDANGNLINDKGADGSETGTDLVTGKAVGGRAIEYSTFDKPVKIEKGGHTTTFAYTPDRSRYQRTDEDADGNVKVTWYLGNVEKIIETKTGQNTTVTLKRYLPGGAIDTKTYSIDPHTVSVAQRGQHLLTGTDQTFLRYTLKDHLGSVDAVLDDAGEVIQRLSFDAFGQRRNAYNWRGKDIDQLLEPPTSTDLSVIATTTRGYTGHEMLDEVGLIHMNGRIYDARIARFVQADPHIDGVDGSQGYNRYSYVHNNPLNATDPTGFFFKKLLRKIASIPILNTLVQVVLTIYCQVCLVAYNAASTYAVTGSLGAAFGSMISAFVPVSNTVAGFFTAAVVGGVTSVMAGGKFGHGFVSAGIGAAIGGPIGGIKNVVARVLLRGIVGGTISKLTGGKFANGASSAAFMELATSMIRGAGNKSASSTENSGRGEPDHIDEDYLSGTAQIIETSETVNDDGLIVRKVDLKGAVADDIGGISSFFIDAVEDKWSGEWLDEDGVKYVLNADLEKSHFNGDVILRAGDCSKDFACAHLGGRLIKVENINGFMNDPTAMAHEFGHLLGFKHFENGHGNVQSYDNIGRSTLKHAQMLWMKHNAK